MRFSRFFYSLYNSRISVIRSSQRILEQQTRMLGEDHPRLTNTRGSLGQSWMEAGETERAEPLLLQALEQVEKEYSADSIESATAPQLARVLGFLRIATSPQEIDRCVAANAFRVLSGGRNPGDEDNSQFIRKGVVGDWKNHFSASLARDFHAVAGAAMDALGYDDPPRT